ncbi:Putative ATP-dependent helicase DinG OS=Lysinibacillus sphaericus OX=1421 GN=dinG_1 PE=4 SV=1 [Lysinibacillus sphaericus]
MKEGGNLIIKNTLGLEIDVRLAKSRDQYLCLKRFEEAEKVETDEWIDDIAFSIPDGVYAQG